MNGIRRLIFMRWSSFVKDRTVLALLSSLFWSVSPTIGLPLAQSSTASAQEFDVTAADEDWNQAWDADATSDPSYTDTIGATDTTDIEQGEVSDSDEAVGEQANPSSPVQVQVPQELITAWIDELKQSTDRWIQVDISDQQLTAWEGNRQVYAATVSTGRAEEPTLAGVFTVQIKQERAWMQGDTYEIPNVPYTMYYSGNYAIHGTYWHDNFGTPVSNGCINLPVDQAAWLYGWASIGTTVVIEP